MILISRLHRRLPCVAAAVLLWVLLASVVLATGPGSTAPNAGPAVPTAPITATQVISRLATTDPVVFITFSRPPTETLGVTAWSFDYLRRRDIRTWVFLSTDTHPDLIRLAVADGHWVGLYLPWDGMAQPPTAAFVEAAVDEWERRMVRTFGQVGPRVVQIDPLLENDATVLETLAGRGYRVVGGVRTPTGQPGDILRLWLGRAVWQDMVNAQAALRDAGLGIRTLSGDDLWPTLGHNPGRSPSDETPPITLARFQREYLIVLDPGHTRKESGTVIRSPGWADVSEAVSNMDRALRLQPLLEAEGWTVVLTHDEEALFDRWNRAPDINDDGRISRLDDVQFRANFVANLARVTGRTPVVISLHVDSVGANQQPAQGPTTFYPAHGDRELVAQSRRLATILLEQLVETWRALGVPVRGRGVFDGNANLSRGPDTGYILLGNEFALPLPGTEALPTTRYVAVLSECGMASDPVEARILITPEGNQALAEAHVRALRAWAVREVSFQRQTERLYRKLLK